MLELKNVSWKLEEEDKWILRDINLKVQKGERLVLTGPNGGGKTTLARVIAGLREGAEGEIWLDGQRIDGLDITGRARAGLGYAFQQPVRFKGVTVEELMQMAAGEQCSREELCHLLSQVGLCARDYLGREVGNGLSGGEIKRVEIATVLARKPRAAVFDEPEAGIDLWSFDKLIQVFGDRDRWPGALVLISHQRRLMEVADTIGVVCQGRLVDIGPREQMLPRLFGEKSGQCPWDGGND
ncbi:ABC transporter ATP-binding protein [Intestinimonas butyriciproducens]|uniref:ABC transporter ATP-binding protein n=1 Tax=Intestinimonas butyriciproducens TaxID=1297617 RepID=UPI001958935C|nr:ATP-binding cassette domain-containing protein [Intestinimonas butyriciproducens]MBM6918174.1 ATP-binding cassette domain-containing protein [Intestinimonas butyriciproducens]